jgi:hypothetical protein
VAIVPEKPSAVASFCSSAWASAGIALKVVDVVVGRVASASAELTVAVVVVPLTVNAARGVESPHSARHG